MNTELLKMYLEVQLENAKSDKDRAERSLRNKQNWLPENIIEFEKELEIADMKVEFYQTQLDNIK